MPPDEPTASPADPGTPAEMERLVADHAGVLFGIACRFCGNPDEAEALVQEVFLHAQRAW